MVRSIKANQRMTVRRPPRNLHEGCLRAAVGLDTRLLHIDELSGPFRYTDFSFSQDNCVSLWRVCRSDNVRDDWQNFIFWWPIFLLDPVSYPKTNNFNDIFIISLSIIQQNMFTSIEPSAYLFQQCKNCQPILICAQ